MNLNEQLVWMQDHSRYYEFCDWYRNKYGYTKCSADFRKDGRDNPSIDTVVSHLAMMPSKVLQEFYEYLEYENEEHARSDQAGLH